MSACANCKKRRDTFRITRQGGGTYRRAGRTHYSSVCADCAVSALAYAPFHAGASSSGYGVISLARIVERIDTDEARTALARYTDGVTAREAADAERRARLALTEEA